MAVAFNAAGVGSSSGASFVTTVSWSHTAAAGAYAVAFVSVVGPATATATYGGTSMTLLGSIFLNNVSSNGTVYMFGLSSVPSGAQTVTATLSTSVSVVGNSMSYTGVGSVGTPTTIFGTSTPSHLLSCTTGQMITHAFGSGSTFTSPSGGTSRYNAGTNLDEAILIQDSTASATFTASRTNNTTPWGGIGAVLQPPAAIPTGLFFPFIR